jgi:PAS domain S-box-containing protein
MDQRTLPPGAFENATFVGEDFKLAGLVEDILQLAPDTNNIVVILGASPLERFWTDVFRRTFAPFEDRVRFTWVNDLTFDQMLELAAGLPPRSFVLLALLLRDAAGVTHNEDEALQRLHAVSRAPINGLYQHQLGLGIVGGRLYQAELQGEESARIAIRVLRGEPVSSFPPLIIGTQGPRYDWRELQRWSIGTDRLPPGSVIAFRQPTVWDRYRWWIVGSVVVGLVQAALIVQLTTALARRRRAERALRDSEERVNLAADSAGAGLWSVDLDSGQLWTTPRLREIFQLPPEEEQPMAGLLARVHPEDRDLVCRSFERISPEQPGVSMECRIVRPDGSLRWIETRGHLDHGEVRRGRRWSGASVDITESKLAEERVRQVFEAAPNAMIMVGEDGLIALVNTQVETVFGYERAELIGQPIETLIPERLRWGHSKRRKDFASDPRARAMGAGQELFGRRKDGSEIPVEVSLGPIRTMEGLFVVASVVDITERQKAEAESQELRQELAHMSRVATMGELSAAIVHEIGQPLTAILTNARAGLRAIAAGHSDVDDVRDILEDIVADDHRAAQVIQHLRALFRKGAVERRPLQLNDIITDVVTVVQRDAGRRRVSLVLDLAPVLPRVFGDRIHLQQVVLNLVMNAFEAMADVPDRARTLTLRSRALDGDRVQVDAFDTGPGIAAEKLASIFRPFVTTKVGGMGMGLSVSASIIDTHEGRLWAENCPEGGAVFHIVLPAIADAEAKWRRGEDDDE